MTIQLPIPFEKTKCIVMYSGGLGSFAAAYLAMQNYGSTYLYFNDTQIEDPDLYRFLKESSDWLGAELILDSDGRTPWEVFEDCKYIGNTRVDPCSRVLKRERAKKYVVEHYPDGDIDVIFGIDWTEIHRYEAIKGRGTWHPFGVKAPLIDALIDKDMLVSDLLKESGIKRPALYEMGFSHNNCGGFCVKAGLGQFKLLWEKLPIRYLWHENKQEQIMAKNPSLRPFLRKTIDGRIHYITLKEYRTKYLSELTEQESLDFGGCGCAL